MLDVTSSARRENEPKGHVDALATRQPPPPHEIDLPSPLVPLVPLDYQSPRPRGPERSDMGWGLLISFLLAMGVGWFIFGAMMTMGLRDDYAGPMAVGAGFFVLGAGVAGSLVWTRRQQQQSQSPR